VGRGKLVVHTDNALAHNSRITQNVFGRSPLKRLPHPPYSPNISPSDFYLFRKVESAPIGPEISDEIALFEAVTEILNSISDAELQSIFQSWIAHVEKVIDAGKDHLNEEIVSFSLSHSRSTLL
jgi:hypothetical protein